MQITMEALERALAPIEAVGNGEVTFKVNGTSVTLRRLSPEEESDSRKFAVAQSDDDTTAMDYIERFKLAILSYSLAAVGSLNLRDVHHVETGEVLEVDGKGKVAVKVARHVAMRKMLLKWAAPARIALYRQYVELLYRVEDLAEDLVEFDASNLDAEIERLEGRLATLRERKTTAAESLESEVSKMVKTIHQKENTPEEEPEDAPQEAIDDQVDTTTVQDQVDAATVQASPPVAVGHRQSAIPTAAKPVVSSVPAMAPVQARTQPNPNPANYAAGMEVPDSFVDMGDYNSMEDAVNAENLRMLQRRQAAARGQDTQEAPSVLSAAHSMRRPPHLAARDMPHDIDDEIPDEITHTGRTVDGVETYRMTPPEEMGSVRPRHPHGTPVSPKGINPRFTAPRKP